MVYQDNYMVVLNSAYATKKYNTTKNSNLEFSFIGLLKQDDDIIRTDISILNAQIPISFYIINSSNSLLYFSYGGVNKAILLTYGNYNAFDFITELTTKFGGVGCTITPTINRNTGVLTFVSSSSLKLYYSISFYSTLALIYGNISTVASIIGLGTSDSTIGTTVVMPYPLNLLGVKKLSIKSSSLSVNAYTAKSLSFTDIICTIPCDQPYFNMISYINANDLNKNMLRAPYIDGIDIQITDEYDNLIDFNGQDWTITIVISNTRIDREKDNRQFTDLLQHYNFKNNLKNKNNIENLIEEKPISEDKKILEFLQK